MDLFGDHRLGLNHVAHPELAGDMGDVSTGLLGVFGPKHMPAAGNYLFFKLKKVLVEMIDSILFNLLAFAASGLPVFEAGSSAENRRVVTIDTMTDNFAVDQVRGFDRGIMQKALCSRRAHARSWARMLAK